MSDNKQVFSMSKRINICRYLFPAGFAIHIAQKKSIIFHLLLNPFGMEVYTL